MKGKYAWKPHLSTWKWIYSKQPFFLVLILRRMLSRFSWVWLFATLWTIAHQAPQLMGFSRLECWSGLSCSSPRDLPDPGTETECPASHADSLLRSHWVLRTTCQIHLWEWICKQTMGRLYINIELWPTTHSDQTGKQPVYSNQSKESNYHLKQPVHRAQQHSLWPSAQNWNGAHKASAVGWPWEMGWGGWWEGVQDGGHTYTHGWFMSVYGKKHYNILK